MEEIRIKVSDKVELRSWKQEYAPLLFFLVSNNQEYLSEWLKWAPAVKEIKDSEKFINDSLSDIEKGIGMELGIWYEEVLVGCVGIHDFDVVRKSAIIGYWLETEIPDKGIMTESLKVYINYIFGKFDLNRLCIIAATKNLKSQEIPKALNFIKEGILREYEFINGRPLDYMLYSTLRSEW